MSTVENTKRIAKNTLLLYGRMFMMMVVSLYTSRKVLEILGPQDNNLFDLVASLVGLFWFLNAAMTSATQRFLNVELEKGTPASVNRVFSMSVNIHIGIAVVVLVVGELIGPWVIEKYLTIPPGRMTAVQWVYQFSLLTTCFTTIRVPYNAMIVAQEKMSMYALLTVAEAVLRLGVVLVLILLAGDKLVLYGGLTCAVVLAMTLIFRWYCRRNFDTCHYRFTRDKTLMKQMTGFSVWSLLENGAGAAAQHGVGLLFNIIVKGGFLNLALGKATQISNALYAFVLNFQTAFTPQLMKSYTANDTAYFRYLIFRASKYSYFLLLLLAIPVMLCAQPLIEWWLGPGRTPDHTASFARLLIGFMLIDAISGPLWSAVQATGRIRNYQIMISSIIFMTLPLSYFALKAGWPPESALAIRTSLNLVAYCARILYMRKHMDFPAGEYVRRVSLVSLAVTALSVPVPWALSLYVDGAWGTVAVVAVSCVWTGSMIFTVGMEKKERAFIVDALRKRLGRSS